MEARELEVNFLVDETVGSAAIEGEGGYHPKRPYFRIQYMAVNPSFQPIFFPSL